MEFSFFLTDTRRVVCKSQFCFLKEFRRKHSSLPPMNTENRIKAIRSCFENWTMRCILCPMNTVSLSFSDQANNSSAVDSLPLLNHNADFTKNELAVSLSCFWFENRGWANEENYFYFNANVTRRSQNRSICRLWSSYDLIAVQVIFFYMEKDLCFQRVWP